MQEQGQQERPEEQKAPAIIRIGLGTMAQTGDPCPWATASQLMAARRAEKWVQLASNHDRREAAWLKRERKARKREHDVDSRMLGETSAAVRGRLAAESTAQEQVIRLALIATEGLHDS